jgi:hypothetical protein
VSGVPPCRGLGRQCRNLPVTLRIGDLAEDTPSERDALATWLLGHTERLTLGRPYTARGELLVDAVIHVPCRHLRTADGSAPAASATTDGTPDAPKATVTCAAHGFRGPLPVDGPRRRGRDRRGSADGRIRVVFQGREQVLELRAKRAPARALPVIAAPNPCVGAPCRTADNTRGAACCRDLTLDIVATLADEELEALLHARQSPYLCKVTRTDETTIECEVISACGYLERDGISCALHGRLLPNGRAAKPFVCTQWPELGPDDVGHPGCRLL